MAGRQVSCSGLLSEKKSFLWKIPNFAKLREVELDVRELSFKFKTCEIVAPLTWAFGFQTWEDPRDVIDLKWDGSMALVLEFGKVPPALDNCCARVSVRIGIGGNQKPQLYYRDLDVKEGKVVISKEDAKWMPNPALADDGTLTADGDLEIEIEAAIFLQDAQLARLKEEFDRVFIRNFRQQLTASRSTPLGITSVVTSVKSKDGVKFPVDRAMLALRSPVFLRMFQTDMKEVNEGVVEVDDMDSKPLEVLLHFMHTAELDENWKRQDIFEGLAYGAHKYVQEDLVEFFEKTLGLESTEGNSRTLSDLVEDYQLKRLEME